MSALLAACAQSETDTRHASGGGGDTSSAAGAETIQRAAPTGDVEMGPVVAEAPSTIRLGANGRAQGTLRTPLSSDTMLTLVGKGPGPVACVVRMADGTVLYERKLPKDGTTVNIQRGAAQAATVVLETGAEAGATVEVSMDFVLIDPKTDPGRRPTLTWDLSRAGN